jgi:hypothetical protein
VTVVSDVPAEDQGKAAEHSDPPAEVTEEELAAYSGGAQKRINQLVSEAHTERRAKEAAERQSEEAIRYAQQVTGDNQRLTDTIAQTNEAFIGQAKERASAQLLQAQEEFRGAQEEGDTDKILQTQMKLNSIQIEQSNLERAIPAVAPPADAGQPQQQQEIQPPPLDPKSTAWTRDNPWFMAAGHEDMSGYAWGLHQKLVAQKIDPTSDEYYAEIDKRMRAVFPDYDFGGTNAQQGAPPAPQTVTPKPTPVVASATRTTGGEPRQVQLTSTQVGLAKRLGLTPEQYARQALKEQQNG